jgi:hypothetical protein
MGNGCILVRRSFSWRRIAPLLPLLQEKPAGHSADRTLNTIDINREVGPAGRWFVGSAALAWASFALPGVGGQVAMQCAAEWAALFHVESKRDGEEVLFVQADSSELLLSNKELHALKNCHHLLGLMDSVDEDCESAILQLVIGIVEGRREGDHVFDSLAAALFPTGESSNSFQSSADGNVRPAGWRGFGGLCGALPDQMFVGVVVVGGVGWFQVVLNNLLKHFQAGKEEGETNGDEDDEQDEDAIHFSDVEVRAVLVCHRFSPWAWTVGVHGP